MFIELLLAPSATRVALYYEENSQKFSRIIFLIAESFGTVIECHIDKSFNSEFPVFFNVQF